MDVYESGGCDIGCVRGIDDYTTLENSHSPPGGLQVCEDMRSDGVSTYQYVQGSTSPRGTKNLRESPPLRVLDGVDLVNFRHDPLQEDWSLLRDHLNDHILHMRIKVAFSATKAMKKWTNMFLLNRTFSDLGADVKKRPEQNKSLEDRRIFVQPFATKSADFVS